MINKKNKNKLLVAALVFLSFLLDVSPSIKLCRGFCLRSSSCQLKDRRHRFNKITNNMSLKTHVSGLCNLMTADIYTRTCARGLSWVGAILSCEVTACHEPIRMTLRGGATKLMEGGGGVNQARLFTPTQPSDKVWWGRMSDVTFVCVDQDKTQYSPISEWTSGYSSFNLAATLSVWIRANWKRRRTQQRWTLADLYWSVHPQRMDQYDAQLSQTDTVEPEVCYLCEKSSRHCIESSME